MTGRSALTVGAIAITHDQPSDLGFGNALPKTTKGLQKHDHSSEHLTNPTRISVFARMVSPYLPALAELVRNFRGLDKQNA